MLSVELLAQLKISTRLSVFFTTRVDGVLEIWDFLYQQKGPILPVKVADYPLLSMKVITTFSFEEQSLDKEMVSQIDGTGKMICAGAGDGTTSVLKLDESLINNSKLDRNNASDMFERFDIMTEDMISLIMM